MTPWQVIYDPAGGGWWTVTTPDGHDVILTRHEVVARLAAQQAADHAFDAELARLLDQENAT